MHPVQIHSIPFRILLLESFAMKVHLLSFLLLFALGVTAKSQSLPPNMYADTAHAPFLYGVASFDPTPSNVILWTKVDPQPGSSPITLNWEVFEDVGLTQLADSGTATASAATDWTAKVDISFPHPGQVFWYRWTDPQGRHSVIGRSKTAPAGPTNRVRLAVMSCSSIFSGYFNAYRRLSERSDIDLVVHLGDYIYDFVDQDERVRVPVPEPVDPQTLAEWRDRHSYYLLDPDLRAARQTQPWAVIWDNHDTDGDSPQHVADALQAFLEYVPMRLTNPARPELIYRKLAYGDLLDLIFFDVTTLRNRDTLPNGDFSMLGDTQWTWLSQELSNSTARWRALGQERMFSQFSTAGLGTLINYGDGPVADSGAWDGFNAERLRLLGHLDSNGIDNNIILSGDIHTSFLCDVPMDYNAYDGQTGAGSVAMEFLPTSISRGNFDEAGITGFLAQLVAGAIALANPHHVYAELTSHGYGILDVQPDTVTAEFWYSPILSVTNTETFATGYQCINGENHWRRQALSNPTVVVSTPAPALAVPFSVEVAAFPNPAGNLLTVQLNSSERKSLQISLLDVATGKVVVGPISERLPANRIKELPLDLSNLPAGRYELICTDGLQRQCIPVVHVR